MAKQKTRSPLKARPLRNPGQSVQEAMHDNFHNQMVPYIVMVAMTGVVAFISWASWLLKEPLNPWIMTALFVVSWVMYQYKTRRAIKRQALLRQALDGERAVAEYLDTLRSEGYRVVHDIVGDNFNLDHVVISPHGIFTVETKTISKPETKEARVVYDGDGVTVGGFTPDRNPVTQAKAQASWLRTLLSEMTGRTFTIRPVVVYPGWYVERKQGAALQQVLVMEPKELGKFIKREPVHLKDTDIALVTHSLKRHVRASWETDKK